MYKSFVRPNLDYADIIYDKPFNEPFKTKIEIFNIGQLLLLLGLLKVNHVIVFIKKFA